MERKDRYDRTLAYLTREGEMHNRALLSEGYAKVLTIPPNDRYESTFEKAEREAKDTDAGLWSTCDRDRIEARSAAARRKTRRERAAARRRVGRAEGAERLGYVPMHGWF
ncbi:MAG: thermonuclease family protein [Thermoleophilaceae bacterium]|nr:thermonuclease family protein [Thermoleophilaceae bacterium]